MQTGSRVICLVMAFVAAVTELISVTLAHEQAKPADLSDATVNEVVANPAPIVTESLPPAHKSAPLEVYFKFSLSPLEMRIMAHAPHLRVIASAESDSRQMASLADANERQLLFVKITLG